MPLISIVLRILAVLVLVLLNGFFVAAEFALVKVRDTQLEPLIGAGTAGRTWPEFILQRLGFLPERGAIGHHAGQPGAWAGLASRCLSRCWSRFSTGCRSNPKRCATSWPSWSASRPSPSCTSAPGNKRPSGWRSKSRCRPPSGSLTRCFGFTAPRIRLCGSQLVFSMAAAAGRARTRGED